MPRIRRPSPAMVVACISLFVALGSTAMAAVVITSNSQVAQGTISGHKPPSGKHPNLIAGSVNGQDVGDNSLGGADVNEGSLTGNVRRLEYFVGVGSSLAPFAKVGPYTIKGSCEEINENSGEVIERIFVNGPAGTADSFWATTFTDSDDGGNHSDGHFIPANTDSPVLTVYGDAISGFERIAGTTMLRTGSTTVQLNFNAVADPRASFKDCFLYGTGTRAT
jgi:hypothetical protein